MTKNTNRGLVEHGEKPDGPRGFLTNDGINISDGFLGRNLVAQNPKLESRQRIYKEERALHPAHTRTIKAFIY